MAKKIPPPQILTQLRNSPFEKVKVAVTDIDGILRGKYMLKDKFFTALKGGFGFCDVVFGWDSADACYDNSKFTGWHTGYPDAQATIDVSSYREIPWENKQPFFLADFSDGSAKKVCPRSLLKNIIEKCEDKGFFPQVGMEFEWFNFKETPATWADKNYQSPQPLTSGMFGYSLLRSSQNQNFFTALMDEMLDFKIPLEGLHTETGPGVYEAALLYSDALEAADRAVLFKTSAKQIGYRFGIMPSFMAKWSNQLPGCSGHVHQSLSDEDGKNLFYKEGGNFRMSPAFESYLAGQLLCLPEILPLLAPTVNSYKRLVDGYWAPTKVSWGVDNRTTAARVISGSAKSTRLETRVPGSDVNPYLAVAACLASGLYGMENKLKLVDVPVKGSAYADKAAKSLAKDLNEATELMANSKIAVELFGPEFTEHFVNTRRWEWRQNKPSETNWELKRYFEII